jgi:hypothetical protein
VVATARPAVVGQFVVVLVERTAAVVGQLAARL